MSVELQFGGFNELALGWTRDLLSITSATVEQKGCMIVCANRIDELAKMPPKVKGRAFNSLNWEERDLAVHVIGCSNRSTDDAITQHLLDTCKCTACCEAITVRPSPEFLLRVYRDQQCMGQRQRELVTH